MSNDWQVKKSLWIIAIAAAGVLGATVGREAVRSYLARAPDVRSQKFLAKLASDTNKHLPIVIDKETELTNVVGLEQVYVFNYKLFEAETSTIDSETFMQQMRPNLTTAACTTPEPRDAFLKRGITLRYVYYDKNRSFIAAIDITPKVCGF